MATFKNSITANTDRLNLFLDFASKKCYNENKNLIAFSNDMSFTNVWLRGQLSNVVSGLSGPFSGTTSFLMIPNTVVEYHSFSNYYAFEANSIYTASIYAKASGYTYCGLSFTRNDSNATGVIANLTGGTITRFNSPFIVNSGIESVGDGWYRIFVSVNVGEGTSDARFVVTADIDGNNLRFSGDTVSGILVTMPQLEYGSSVTPYEETTDYGQIPNNIITNNNKFNFTRNVNFTTNSLNRVGFSPREKGLIFHGNDVISSTYSSTDLNGDPIFSVEAVFKRLGNISNGGLWCIGGGNLNLGITDYTTPSAGRENEITIDLWGVTTFTTEVDYPLNRNTHVVWVKKGTGFTVDSLSIYVNGVEYTGANLKTQRNNSSVVNMNTSSVGITIGRVTPSQNLYYTRGQLNIFKIYNKALTTEEVKRNFLQYKTRFNIS